MGVVCEPGLHVRGELGGGVDSCGWVDGGSRVAMGVEDFLRGEVFEVGDCVFFEDGLEEPQEHSKEWLCHLEKESLWR